MTRLNVYSFAYRSERPWHSQHVLAHVRQDEIGRDRRHLIEARLAELAFDIVLGRESEAAVSLQAHVGGFPRRIGAEQLRHVRFSTARLVGIEQRSRLVA